MNTYLIHRSISYRLILMMSYRPKRNPSLLLPLHQTERLDSFFLIFNMFSSTSSLILALVLAVAASPAQRPFGTGHVSKLDGIPEGWIDPRILGGQLLDVCTLIQVPGGLKS
jgi:hypothetical protein